MISARRQVGLEHGAEVVAGQVGRRPAMRSISSSSGASRLAARVISAMASSQELSSRWRLPGEQHVGRERGCHDGTPLHCGCVPGHSTLRTADLFPCTGPVHPTRALSAGPPLQDRRVLDRGQVAGGAPR